jgi:aldose 1-epimerase
MTLHTLQNPHWQVGILPKTGASIAFGRARYSGTWVDVFRPTPEADYDNSSKCSSFIMLPWCNRIKGGLLRFAGESHQLATTTDDGTARHGDVRGRPWAVAYANETSIKMVFNSRRHEGVNYPFRFAASAEYALRDQELVMTLTLKNEDTRAMPAGFGHHPYFVRPDGDNAPLVQIPCDHQFELRDYMATGAPTPIEPTLDFREMRGLPQSEINDVLTGREGSTPVIIRYPQWGVELAMFAYPVFAHYLLFAPAGQPFFAVEPMSNVSDGFNLYADGVPGSGVFVLQPGESQTGVVRIAVNTLV